MSALARKDQADDTSGTAGRMNRGQTIYLVDDDPAVCNALGMFLESEGYTVTPLASAEALLGAINDAPPGVLVLDQRMNGMSGLELQSELTSQGIKWPIVFISGHSNVDISVRAMKAGAIDFLEKPFSNKDLLECIKTAFSRTETTEEDHIRRVAAERRCSQLTPREREVMQLVASGHHNKDIARRLELSTRTVEVHRSRVMAKMDADTLPDLVRMVDLCRLCAHRINAD